MEIENGLEVVVLAGTWFNRTNKGQYSAPISAKVIGFDTATVTLSADIDEFKKKPVVDRGFWYNEVFIRDYWERGHNVTVDQYLEIPAEPDKPDIEDDRVLNLEKRVLKLEKELKILRDHVHNKYQLTTSIGKHDL